MNYSWVNLPVKFHTLDTQSEILNFCLFLCACCCSSCGSSLDEVIKKRGFQRSVMQYSTFDWSSIPLSEERRLAAENVPVQPRILTVRFR